MKFLSIAILLTLLSGAAFGQEPDGRFNYRYKVAATSKFIKDLTSDELAAAFGLWAKTALKGKLSDDNFETHVFGDPAKLEAMFKTKQYNCYVVSPEKFSLQLISPKEILIPLREGQMYTQYVLLVKKAGAIKKLADLKNRRVILFDGFGMNMASIWLEHAMTSGAGKDSGACPLNLVTTEKPMDGIHQVFFGQSDAVVVTLRAFRTACLLNPQLEQRLAILHRSPELIPLAFFFDPRLESDGQIFLRESLLDMHKTPGGKQVLTIFQCTEMKAHPVSVLDGTLAFLREATAGQ